MSAREDRKLIGWYSQRQRQLSRELNKIPGNLQIPPAVVYLTPDHREVVVTEVRHEIDGPCAWADAVCMGPVLEHMVLQRLP